MSLNSLFTGLSGIQVHQTRTNVVADNIANINTTGFKTRRANFEELLAQTIEAATRPQGSTSGTNPVQAGTGVRLKSIDTNFAQGTIATTDRVTDLAIDGDAMFILRDASNNNFYTRDGSFSFDGEGRLVNPSNGMIVQGNVAIDGSFDTTATSNLQDVQIGLDLPRACRPFSVGVHGVKLFQSAHGVQAMPIVGVQERPISDPRAPCETSLL